MGLIVNKITQKKLKETLKYDCSTGLFYWIKGRRGIKAGSLAGCHKGSSYVRIRVFGTSYLAHRLAWVYVYGYMPENEIDHINRDKKDNRIKNLREVARQCNLRNSRLHPKSVSGIKGVNKFYKCDLWRARIKVDFKEKHLGYFKNKLDAARARWEGEKKYGFPDCNTKSTAYLYLKENGGL